MFHVKHLPPDASPDALPHLPPDASREAVLAVLGATPEQAVRLDAYVALLMEAQKGVNLIGPGTHGQIWQRHILDSAQLRAYIPPHISPNNGRIMDMGSGAGFPGLVLAILMGDDVENPIELVEADGRKCRFLEAVIEATRAPAVVVQARFEDLPPRQPDIILARAVAGLEVLLKWSRNQYHADLTCLFMKGKKVNEELTHLKNYPKITCTTAPSCTHVDGVILCLKGFDPAGFGS